MKAILYILLGFSLGTGLTLIALQERFLRERRRLLALGESYRAKGDEALDELNKKWDQDCRQHREALQACQEQLTTLAAVPPSAPPDEYISRLDHERLVQEKNTELSRLASDIKGTADLIEGQRKEINELQGQIALLQGDIARREGTDSTAPAELIARHQQELDALHGQLAALQAEVSCLEKTRTEQPPLNDDFILLGAPNGHLLPGSVVRAFIKGRQVPHNPS